MLDKCITLLQSYGLSSLKKLKQVHAFSIRHGVSITDPEMGKHLIFYLVSLPSPPPMSYAHKIFYTIEEPFNVFIWNTLIRGYAETCDSVSALSLFREMRASGLVEPDTHTYPFLLKAVAKMADVRLGETIHSVVIRSGFGSLIFAQNSLLHLYGNCGDVAGAYKVFDEMPVKDLVAWNSVINGFAENGKPNEALGLYSEMMGSKGIKPDGFTIVGLLSACAKIGALALGKRVHVFMIKVGLTGNLHSCNVLLDFYARCGRVEEAKTLFSEMVEKNSVSWTSLIVGLAVNGFGKEAIELFKDMESKEGLLPCEITFVGILYACSHCGMVDEGFEYFRRMREVYKIEPRIEHFGCMVDLLARAGEVKKAYEYIKAMPMHPNVVIWRTLLGACTVHGDSDLAELARIKILQLEPNHSGDYVLLSNMYASEQRWSDVQKIRSKMLEDGVRKVPGHSLVEVGNRVHEFLMGDKSHPQSEQIYAKLKEMSDRLRVEGYVPQISSVYVDVEEEEKENALVYHSEKIAIAFMLISTPERSPIRVVKNLRVCADCHLAIKLVSKVYEREIVVRDRSSSSKETQKENRIHCLTYQIDSFHLTIESRRWETQVTWRRWEENSSVLSEKEKHVGDASIEKANDKKHQGSSKSRISKKRGFTKNKEKDLDPPGPIVMKPSSQTKKRVQLLQNQASENFTKSTESFESAEKLKDYTEETVIRLNEHTSLNKVENMAPFFWLRDEDDEESLSQPAESDPFLDVTPVDVPSFSDLKDSDHDSPSKAVEQERPNPGDMFDSEMFEWTQRPSSPEILPSPVKAKAVGKDETRKNLSNGALPNKKRKAETARKKVAKRLVEVSKEDYMEPSAGASEKQETAETSGTSTRKDENVKAKRATRNKGQTSRVQAGVTTHVEAEGKQGTKRKRSSVKVSLDPPVAESNELSLGTEDVEKEDQELTHGSADTQPTEKYSLRKRRKSSASSSPKYSPGITEKKTSEKRSKVVSCSIPRRVTQPGSKKILSVELNQVGDRQDSTNKKKLSVDKGTHTMQVSEKRSTMNKPSLGDNALLRRCDGPPINEFTCAFCQTSEDTEASGEMAHYHRSEPVSADFSGGSKVIHVHKNCAEWAPNVYFNNLTAVNLDAELTRSRRITCSSCGLKGAALGCYNASCKSSFHVTCAKLIPECRWDNKNFVMLCPSDAFCKLPCEETSPKGRKHKRTPPKGPQRSQPNQVSEKPDISELQSKPFHGLSKKLVLCCSGLTDEEKSVISEFAELSGVTISRKWEPRVTHIIASINDNGACKRTLKFMMGVLEGKWILSIDWIKACMNNREYVTEEPYEISIDVHGTRQGPYIGRQRALDKEPKLFNGLKFYIMGDFELAYKGYLQDMIVAAGGTILRRRPIADDDSEASTIIVFNVEPSKQKTLTQRRYDAEALAKSSTARAASSSWVLDSIAGCQILDLI
ncbi:hypothetical protein IGI04_001119 [Brassica rapa subsp. trilocularis]|uniref:Uncharacterized protein n=1 Tax=Brassica rapa subsp. trilocularis TaxID=1813537 RepID=A0ABQ7NRR3_BRACM|nr:hypothetical protein IGI04_001119 [Brassica rapa subsp. trilocularis]